MNLNDHLSAVGDRILVVVLLGLLGAGAGYAAAASQAPGYESSALIALGARRTADSSLSSATQALYDRSVPSTLAQMAASGSVANAAARASGLDATTLDVKAVVANDANVVEVTVTGASPIVTRDFATEIASQAMFSFNQLYPLFRTVNIGPAALGRDTRVSPAMMMAAGGLAGCFLGSLVALAWGRRQRPLNVVEEPYAQAAG